MATTEEEGASPSSSAEMESEAAGIVPEHSPPAKFRVMTGSSAATSSSNPNWHLPTRQRREAVDLYSCKLHTRITAEGPARKRGRASVRGRPCARSTCQAGRRAVGPALLCLDAVTALHRNSKGQERAITSTQVPGPSAVRDGFGAGAEMTPETTKATTPGEHGDLGSNAGRKHDKDVAEVGKNIADHHAGQGVSTSGSASVNVADTRDDLRIHKHGEEPTSAGADNRGREMSTGGKKPKAGKNKNGQKPLQIAAPPSESSTMLDTHAEIDGELHAGHEIHSTTVEDATSSKYKSQQYPQEQEPSSSRQASPGEVGPDESYGLQRQQPVKGRDARGDALRSSHSVSSSGSSGSGTGGLNYAADFDVTIMDGEDTREDATPATSLEGVHSAASLVEQTSSTSEELEPSSSRGALSGTAAAMASGIMLRYESVGKPRPAKRPPTASNWTISEQLRSIWRTIVGFFSKPSVSAPSEAGDLGPADDMEFTALRERSLSLLQLQIDPFFADEVVGKAIQERKIKVDYGHLCSRATASSDGEFTTILTDITLTGETASQKPRLEDTTRFFCECPPAHQAGGSSKYDWQFQRSSSSVTATGEQGSSESRKALTHPDGSKDVKTASSCRIHAVKPLSRSENSGRQNDGLFLVRSEQAEYADGAEPSASIGIPTMERASLFARVKTRIVAILNTGREMRSKTQKTGNTVAPRERASSPTKLFCKKLRHSSGKGGKPEQSESECRAAAYFVEQWRANVKLHAHSSDADGVLTPFCKPLRQAVDAKQHTALCMDPMDEVNVHNLLATLGLAPEEDTSTTKEVPQNVLWWTWESIRVLAKAQLFHRDIKPANFLARSASQADHGQEPTTMEKMWIATDMGLACSVGNKLPASGLVTSCSEERETGHGTAFYMSPDHFFNPSEVSPLHAASGDAFSWAVAVVDGVWAQCALFAHARAGVGVFLLLGYGHRRDDHPETATLLIRIQEKIALPEAILAKMSGGPAEKSAAVAGRELLEWIRQKVAGKNPSEGCTRVIESLDRTLLTPLKRDDINDHDPRPVKAIDLMASALLGNPWISNEYAPIEKNYIWEEARTVSEKLLDGEGKATADNAHVQQIRGSRTGTGTTGSGSGSSSDLLPEDDVQVQDVDGSGPAWLDSDGTDSQ
ncbi:unnamed protein product [Amoebophrya sp. A25]|nr:unnamed protein product [Amoebophrya sp. A25]|eukprot:GSA25T00014773001.1